MDVGTSETDRRTFDVEMRCCRQDDTDVFCLVVAESVLLLLGSCKYRMVDSVVCVNTSASHGNELGSFDAAIWCAGQVLRWTEVTSCTSLLCVVTVSMVNVTLDTIQSRCAEYECRVIGSSEVAVCQVGVQWGGDGICG